MDDVIVVGGGPGGASAAYHLGQAGLKVHLFEKETLPRYKACGGGVSLRALARYFPFSFEPVIESRATSIGYAYRGDAVTIPINDDSLTFVMRDRFDAFILDHARAEIHQGTAIQSINEAKDHVQVTTRDGQTFQARYLIGADGASSIASHAVRPGDRRRPAAGVEIETPVSEAVLKSFAGMPLFIFGDVRYGYAWIFPKRDHLSVGIAVMNPKPGELQAKVRESLTRFGIDPEQGAWHGHPIPLYFEPQRLATRRILLVGDAAGLVDPLSGEGIRLAIKSGYLAAQAIIRNDLRSYEGTINRSISNSYRFGVPLARLFYRLTGPCFALGVHNPYANRAFIDLLSDRIGYGGVILRLFGTLPLFAMQESVKWLSKTRSR